jgi:hypothetical protein
MIFSVRSTRKIVDNSLVYFISLNFLSIFSTKNKLDVMGKTADTDKLCTHAIPSANRTLGKIF